MEIDIIDFLDEQYATLTEGQILEIREAQEKKNALTAKLEKNLQAEKERLIENGTFRSGIWPLIKAKMQEEYEKEVEWMRETLLFYLRFTGMPNAENVPYKVDYSLSYKDRAQIVKEYYMSAYDDAYERINAFKADDFVCSYIGEYYKPLYDYILEKTWVDA